MLPLRDSPPATPISRQGHRGCLPPAGSARLFRLGRQSPALGTVVLAAFMLLLTGCAPNGSILGSSYHDSDNMWKLGYSDLQLNTTVYRVSYAGYGIPQSACDEFALMRAADLARDKDYKYFRIVTERQSSQSQAFALPGSTYTTGTVSNYGNSSTINAMSYSNGLMGTLNYPVTTLTIEMLKEQDSSPETLNADLIWSSLAKKHGVMK